MTNPLRTLQEYGQSVWLDFVSRELLKSGGLGRLVAEDGIRGRGWSAEHALDVARVVLLENPRRIFGRPEAKSRPSI